MKWYRKQGITIRAAIIGGGFAILAGIITGIVDALMPNPPIIVQYAPTDSPNLHVGTDIPKPSLTNETTTPSTPLVTATVTEDTAPRLIFKETFENNNADWSMWNGDYDGYSEENLIKDGKYYWSIQTKDTYEAEYTSISIPNVIEKDFCLTFDARLFDTTENAVVSVYARENDLGTGHGTYYIIRFFSDGTGLILLSPRVGDNKQIALIEKGISWNDGRVHTVKVSLQGSDLDIYDAQAGSLIHEESFTDEDLLLNAGELRLGLAILNPSQKTTAEFDNVYIYDKCP